jgi:hypothetical protein
MVVYLKSNDCLKNLSVANSIKKGYLSIHIDDFGIGFNLNYSRDIAFEEIQNALSSGENIVLDMNPDKYKKAEDLFKADYDLKKKKIFEKIVENQAFKCWEVSSGNPYKKKSGNPHLKKVVYSKNEDVIRTNEEFLKKYFSSCLDIEIKERWTDSIDLCVDPIKWFPVQYHSGGGCVTSCYNIPIANEVIIL